MTFTSTNWVHTTNDHNFFFSRNWMPSNNDLYFNKLIGFIYTTNDHNFFVSRNWMPSKLIMTFKRASWTQSINLDIGLQFLLTTKCHQEPKKIVYKTSCRQLNAKIEKRWQLSSFPQLVSCWQLTIFAFNCLQLLLQMMSSCS